MTSEEGGYRLELRVHEIGRIVSIGDGISWIEGLPSCYLDELLLVEDGSQAQVFQLAEGLVGAILITQSDALRSGLMVRRTHRVLRVPVGDALIGRVVDPLGAPLDDKPKPRTEQTRLLDAAAPPIIQRDFVRQPLQTGSKIVDNLIPIGKGQRQLLMGDNGLGKTSFALDVILNQRGKGVVCVYVLIGQRRSVVLNVLNVLEKFGAFAYTCVVLAEATSLPGMRFLAPYAGCALAEHWLYNGQDTLVVFDDLTLHAQSYRELSLLLRRAPGREAFPADIFYLHSRLLERASCLNAEQGGGSLTALPMIETREGEISSYIPTNLISITDGQIYFDEQLFASGFLPAIDIRRSVSRIGGHAQWPAIKREASRLRLLYLQFLELESFTRFGTKLDSKTSEMIKRGRVLRWLLKQDRFKIYGPAFQYHWMVAYNDGLLDELHQEQLKAFMDQLEVEPTCQDEGSFSLDRKVAAEKGREILRRLEAS